MPSAQPTSSPLPWWEVRSRQHVAVVEAPNWVSALGMALAALGLDRGLERLACERLSNGVIIANDLSRGERFTVIGG